MVVITVILAAVIAAFAFGWIGDVHVKKSVAFSIRKTDPTHADVTYTNPGGASTVSNLVIASGGSWAGPAPVGMLSVGQSWKMTLSGAPAHVVLTAMVDGDNQVILNADI